LLNLALYLELWVNALSGLAMVLLVGDFSQPFRFYVTFYVLDCCQAASLNFYH